MTRSRLLIYFAAIALLAPSTCHASLDRLLTRRQSGEAEQESTTPKSQTDSAQQQPPPPPLSTGTPTGASNGAPNTPTGSAGSPPARLYPDLPQGPVGGPNFLPPFNARPQHGGPMPPFVPFGMVPTRLNADQQPGPFGPRMLPPLRQMSPAERLQSQSFTDGLGKRLLSLIGIDTGNQQQQNETTDGQAGGGSAVSTRSDGGSNNNMNPMRALENSTVLQELNKRVNMVMSGLSRMYNSTVQEQLNLLNERFKKETANSTNLWQQRVAQQVPMFFEQMAGKVSQAQEQLNRVWRDITQVAQGNGSFFERPPPGSQGDGQPPRQPFFNAIHQFMNPHPGDGAPFFGGGHQSGVPNGGGGDFVDQLSRSLGMQGGQPSAANGSQPDLGARLREFWHVQVQPQIGMVRNQMARVWRDLTTSGALSPETVARSGTQSLGGSNNQSSTNDLVDSILKEVDAEASEFALITPKSDSSSSSSDSGNGEQTGTQSPPASGLPKLSPQMQNRLAAMQRDLNQLWQGLTSSLQSAVNNVRATLNPRPQFAPPGPFGGGPMNNPNQAGPQETDPEQNAINDKVKDLSKLQREADVIYDTVQQRQREERQRQTFADRFRGFINNVDQQLNHLPEQLGERMNRFGAVIGNFWNTIPERFDNMMAHRQNQENQAKLEAQINSKLRASTPASVSENTVMSGN